MALYEHDIKALDGSPLDLRQYEGAALLVVNVAPRCGLTPQYEGLEALHERYAPRGFSVLGVPSGEKIHRFRAMTDPEAPELTETLKAILPG